MSTDPDDDPTPPRDPVLPGFAPPPPDHPAHALLWLLEECRRRGYRLGPVVELEGLRAQVADLRQEGSEAAGRLAATALPPDFARALGEEG